MKRLLILTLALAALGAIPGMRAATQPSPADLEARAAGRTLFMNHCASCHGSSARGDGPAAVSLRRVPSNLTTFAQDNGGVFPSERLRRIIDGREVGAHGSVEMPVWGAVFKANATDGGEKAVRGRIDAILTYLQSIQERRGEEY